MSQPTEAVPPTSTPPAPSSVPVGRYEVTLPSGKVAHILTKITGRHLIVASRVAGPTEAQNMHALFLAVASITALIDGKSMPFEDIQQLSISDTLSLISEVMSGGKKSDEPSSAKST